jgi:hypothetical protein
MVALAFGTANVWAHAVVDGRTSMFGSVVVFGRRRGVYSGA